MHIRSLVNNNVATIANCESEPIHIPGSIQPHGFLLGVKKSDFTIGYCSENCTVFLGQPLKAILGQPLQYFFDEAALQAFLQDFAKQETTPGELVRPFIFTRNQASYTTIAHESGNVIILEFELVQEQLYELPDLYIQTKRFKYHTERADNLKTFCQDIAEETRRIIGYDRVMVYRFDDDSNGEVYAESRRPDLEPYLGLFYPHTDIPAQARALYLRNPIRLIADVAYEPVPLYALDDTTTANLDLSFSMLRSVSPIHISYLKNMQVGASFSISLVYRQKLWGLISCHHTTPKHIPYYTRLAAHLQGVFLASQIDVRQVADEFELVKETDKKLNALHEKLAKEENALAHTETLNLLQSLLNADGVVVQYRETLYKNGVLPPDAELKNLMSWLLQTIEKGSYHTAKLINHYPQAQAIAGTVAGVYFLTLGKNSRNCILWTRQEVETTINWAGNPHKAIEKDDTTQMLTPRKSFQLWKEAVQYQSRAWLRPEMNAAALICSAIQSQLHLADLKEEELRYRNLNGQLQKANEELANMNWISTHDLKEPLRKIQMYASVIMEKQGNEIPVSVKTNISRMQTSAAKMQVLIDDLLSYTKILNEEERFALVNLNAVLEEVQSELQETIVEKKARLHRQQLPVIKGIGFQLRQLFINLIGNALKFSKEGVPPVININCILENKRVADDTTKSFYKISVADNGVGISNAFAGQMFKIFQRFHGSHYPGSGIGLAICKKITEAHGGFIEVNGHEGVGTTFHLYFPQSDGATPPEQVVFSPRNQGV